MCIRWCEIDKLSESAGIGGAREMKKEISYFYIFIITVIGFIGATGFIFAKKVATLSPLIYPRKIIVDKNQIFISDYPTIYIYSGTDYKLLKKFGGAGQGPGEFYMDTALIHQKEKGLQFYLEPDYVLVNSMGRVSFFSRHGEFRRMIRFNPFGTGRQFIPMNKYFAAWENVRTRGDMYTAVNLYGPDLKKINEIYQCDFPFIFSTGSPTKVHFFRLEGPIYDTYDNKLFTSFSGIQKFAIDVFDENGKNRYAISTDYKKIKLTENDVRRYKSEFKYLYKRALERNLKNTIFPEYYPAIRHFSIANGKLYVLTFKKEGNKSEFIIFDIKGNLLKKIMLPVAEMNAKRFFPYSIDDDRFYQIVENEDEIWELHVHNIE